MIDGVLKHGLIAADGRGGSTVKRVVFLATMTAFLALALCGCKESVQRDPGVFQLRLAGEDPQPNWFEVKVHDITKPVYVSPEVAATAADIKKAYVAKIGSHTDKPITYRGKPVKKGVAIEFTAEAAKRIETLTTEHVDERLAILVANRVISAPRITEPIKKRMLFFGSLSDEDCEALVALLNGGQPAK